MDRYVKDSNNNLAYLHQETTHHFHLTELVLELADLQKLFAAPFLVLFELNANFLLLLLVLDKLLPRLQKICCCAAVAGVSQRLPCLQLLLSIITAKVRFWKNHVLFLTQEGSPTQNNK